MDTWALSLTLAKVMDKLKFLLDYIKNPVSAIVLPSMRFSYAVQLKVWGLFARSSEVNKPSNKFARTAKCASLFFHFLST